MEFSIRLGPLTIPWIARIEGVSLRGFTDRQLRGPFQQWQHRHSFKALDDASTEVYDEITATLDPRPLAFLLGLGMWLGLPLLFAYRARKTRSILATQEGV
jgi:ligand-binding SRPBCC domain-containing protein